MDKLYETLDPIFMSFFRITPDPILSFFLGTFILTMIGVLIGEFTLSVAFLFNRRYVEKLNRDLIKWNNLSIDAIKDGNGEAYRAFNEQANEAFGRLFFLSVAYSAASLWPAPFALGWMQRWFSDISIPLPFALPLVGHSASYTFVCILSYITASFIFSLLKPHLPYFKQIHKILNTPKEERERLRSFTELFESSSSS